MEHLTETMMSFSFFFINFFKQHERKPSLSPSLSNRQQPTHNFLPLSCHPNTNKATTRYSGRSSLFFPVYFLFSFSLSSSLLSLLDLAQEHVPFFWKKKKKKKRNSLLPPPLSLSSSLLSLLDLAQQQKLFFFLSLSYSLHSPLFFSSSILFFPCHNVIVTAAFCFFITVKFFLLCYCSSQVYIWALLSFLFHVFLLLFDGFIYCLFMVAFFCCFFLIFRKFFFCLLHTAIIDGCCFV